MDVAETIGELFVGPSRFDPYPIYDQLRRHAPLAQVQEMFFVASGYATIDELLRDGRTRVPDREQAAFYNPSLGPDEDPLRMSLLSANPPDHTRLRRLVSGAFTARRVAQLRDTVLATATNLAGYLEHLGRTGEPVDFMAEFAYPLPIRVICALLGVATQDLQWFREQAADLTTVLEPAQLVTDADRAERAAMNLDTYFGELIARRRVEPADDLTTALVQVHDSDGSMLSRDELLATLRLLLVAGFETTTNLLGNGLVTLLHHDAQRVALRDNPDLAPAYVEEMLRYDAPVQLTSRYSREPLTLGGVRVPEYGQILLLLGSGNRDPERFAAADVFDPAREQNYPLTFGAGSHYCLGAPLARMEAQLAFPLLLAKFPRLALAGEPIRRDRLTLRGYEYLPLTL